MIAVDSSAIVALGLRESGWEKLKETITTQKFGIGWPTLLESHIVLRAKGVGLAEVLVKDLLAIGTATPIEFGLDHYITQKSPIGASAKAISIRRNSISATAWPPPSPRISTRRPFSRARIFQRPIFRSTKRASFSKAPLSPVRAGPLSNRRHHH